MERLGSLLKNMQWQTIPKVWSALLQDLWDFFVVVVGFFFFTIFCFFSIRGNKTDKHTHINTTQNVVE